MCLKHHVIQTKSTRHHEMKQRCIFYLHTNELKHVKKISSFLKVFVLQILSVSRVFYVLYYKLSGFLSFGLHCSYIARFLCTEYFMWMQDTEHTLSVHMVSCFTVLPCTAWPEFLCYIVHKKLRITRAKPFQEEQQNKELCEVDI
jgi:hypothetical protein